MTGPIRTEFVSPRSLELDRVSKTLEMPEQDSTAFGDVFKKVLNDTSGLQDTSKNLIGAFLRGEPVELHQVMAASEEAQLSLELLVELRNKLTDAYRAVMNLQ
jgi:flagellar hook-basal body complex protein FliE